MVFPPLSGTLPFFTLCRFSLFLFWWTLCNTDIVAFVVVVVLIIVVIVLFLDQNSGWGALFSNTIVFTEVASSL